MADIIQLMLEHAKEVTPQECCGLVVAVSGSKKPTLVRAKNMSEQPCIMFEIAEEAWLEAAELGEVIAVYHSHPTTSAQPSAADKVMCEATNLPWYVVAPWNDDAILYQPCGYEAPYEGRPFYHGVLDCFALVRDWYNREWDLGIKNYDRQWDWWTRGGNLYVDNFKAEGFINLGDGVQPEVGDAFLMQLGADVPNHAAVFVGDGKVLQHVRDRLSTIDVYGGFWQKNTVMHLRHKSRM